LRVQGGILIAVLAATLIWMALIPLRARDSGRPV
jgi:hypothetical protein